MLDAKYWKVSNSTECLGAAGMIQTATSALQWTGTMAMEGLNKELTGHILQTTTAALVITQGLGETSLSDRNILACMRALLGTGMMRVGGGISMEAGQARCQVV